MLLQTGEWFLENKHKPLYLGAAVSIFCLLWGGVGDSQESEGRKTWDPAQLEQSATTQSTETSGKREARRVMGVLTNLVVLLMFYHFISFSYHFQYCLREHRLCECSITEEDLCGLQGRKEDIGGTNLHVWVDIAQEGINIVLVWPWLNL